MAKLLGVLGFAAALVASPAAQTIEHIDPAGGFTHVVTVTDRGVKTIYVSGQVGQGEDYRTHVESAFSSVVRRLEQAGATVNDVVKMRAFVKDLTPDLYGPVAEVRRQTFPEGSWPASTGIVLALSEHGSTVLDPTVAASFRTSVADALKTRPAMSKREPWQGQM